MKLDTIDRYARFCGNYVKNSVQGDLDVACQDFNFVQSAFAFIFAYMNETQVVLLKQAFKCCQLMEGLSIGIERCELKRIKESTIECDARNYRWLRDREYKYKFSLLSNKAAVVDAKFTTKLIGVELDTIIEQDVEGDARFSNWEWRFSDSRYDELEEKAKKELGLL